MPVASIMTWVENFLNLTNGYYKVASSDGDQFEYLVPIPPGYTSTIKAHWTTDVIVLDPSCSWQTAMMATGPNNSSWDVTLPQSNLSIRLETFHFGMFLMFSYVYLISVSSNLNVTQVSVFLCNNASATEFIAPVDGSVLFVVDQLNYPLSHSVDYHTISVDLSSIPTLKFPTGNVLAFLLCSPHVSIQTCQVLATGNGNLTLGKHQPSQGNIDFYQANYLLSHILLDLPTHSGPTTEPGAQVGTDMMVRLIFGTNVARPFHMPPATPPAPITNITAVYTQLIQSAMKTVLSGAVDTEPVPGSYTEEQMVFILSLGHIIVSAILFASGNSQKYIETDIAYIAPVAPLRAP